jgi:hypothetical protein
LAEAGSRFPQIRMPTFLLLSAGAFNEMGSQCIPSLAVFGLH